MTLAEQPPQSCEIVDDSGAATQDTLFYDGQCPLCSKEINQLKRSRGDSLTFVDIHAISAAQIEADTPSQTALLQNLHVRKADGRWLTGADANVEAWEGTAMAPLGRVLRLPVLRPLVNWFYGLWARRRYQRLYGSKNQ